MKTLELENCGLQEMNASEMESVDGGLIIKLLFATIDTSAKDKWEWFWEDI